MKELVFLDCETTGTEPGDDKGEIVELAIVSEAGQTLFDRKILPQHIETATKEAMSFNGYDSEVWAKEAVPFKDVAQEVFSLIDGKTIVGQHVTFDTEFLQYEIRRSGIDANVDRISYYSIDISSIIFFCLVPPLRGPSLHFACEHFNISNEGAHTALVDTQRAREVYFRLMEMKPMLRWPGSEIKVDLKDRKLIRQFQQDYKNVGAEHGVCTKCNGRMGPDGYTVCKERDRGPLGDGNVYNDVRCRRCGGSGQEPSRMSGVELAKLDAEIERKRVPFSPGPIKAMFLRKGDRFSYPGSFKPYEAQSDAVPDSCIKGKVVLLVTDHGLRDRMPTRLDASLICELYER